MVSSLDAAVKFYTETLGLTLTQRYGEHYAEIQAANLSLGLHPVSETTQFGTNLSIGFGVTDFDIEVKNAAVNVARNVKWEAHGY